MASLKIGANEYNMDFVQYGTVVPDGFLLHFADGGEVTHAMPEDKAQQVLALLPLDKQGAPKAKRSKVDEPKADTTE